MSFVKVTVASASAGCAAARLGSAASAAITSSPTKPAYPRGVAVTMGNSMTDFRFRNRSVAGDLPGSSTRFG